MSLMTIGNVKKFYGRQDVLKGATFQINPGERVGLIGANGAGKTTLLRLILEEETPDEGVIAKVKGLRMGHLPQDLMVFSGQTLLGMVMDTAENVRAIEGELAFIAQDIEETAQKEPRDEAALLELTARQGQLLSLYESLGGYTLEAEAKKILAGLGFNDQDFSRPIDSFSGGWIMRAVLARLLLAGPDILLLDEPTNHLDVDSLLWLENYLLSASSALLVVSHDRVFLNNVAQRIVEVDRGLTYSYTGSYDHFLEEKEKRLTTEAATYASQQDRIKQIEKFIERNKVRASTARRAQSRMKMLDKMEKIEAPTPQVQSFHLSLPKPARAPDNLVELHDIIKSYGAKTVYRGLDLTIRRGDRIALMGPNGLGKSTLMKIIAGVTDFQEGTRRVGDNVVISYFAQFQLEELDPNRTVIDELAVVGADLTPGRLRSILAGFLFQGEDVFKKVAVLSGGEKTRLILAKIMLVSPNLLLLDEPTNHLDIPGRDLLETALRDYTGTICLISHDRHLIDAVANRILIISDGRVDVFPGNFHDYREIWQNKAGPAAEEAPDGLSCDPISLERGRNETRADREARKRAEAEARKNISLKKAPLVREIERLEEELAELGCRLDDINRSMTAQETYQDPERAKTLNQEYGLVKSQMDRATRAWEDAALRLEDIEEELARSAID